MGDTRVQSGTAAAADSHQGRWAKRLWSASIGLAVLACSFMAPAAGARANDVEARFVKAGLVDVQQIDPSIRVDLVNSDPKKNYFPLSFEWWHFNGLPKAEARKRFSIIE